MRRRRRTKYNWFPIIGQGNDVDPTRYSSTLNTTLDVASNELVTGWAAVVNNTIPTDTQEINHSLQDVIGNEYLLKRVVGKCFVDVQYALSSPTNINELRSVFATAGLFVARSDMVNATDTNPVDSAAADVLYSPLNAALMREPWVWRRTWLLGPGDQMDLSNADSGDPTVINPNPLVGSTTGATVLAARYPANNTAFAGVLDGPHVDAKTGRRVRQDEALFWGFSAHFQNFKDEEIAGVTTHVSFHTDVRVLATLRRAKNRSNF